MAETWADQWEAARTEVVARMAELMYEQHRLRSAGIEPSGVLLPARLNPDGDDEFGATCMGLPVTWAPTEQWGLVVKLPAPA